MAVWKLKSCPRCSGDLFIQRETDGWYEECLLCGYQRDVSNIIAAKQGTQLKVRAQMTARQKTYANVSLTDAN